MMRALQKRRFRRRWRVRDFHQLLQQAITEYLEALRAWARHNQQPQALIDTKASKPAGNRNVQLIKPLIPRKLPPLISFSGFFLGIARQMLLAPQHAGVRIGRGQKQESPSE
jgi:hypothetical protein